jgi:hypothetical protein
MGIREERRREEGKEGRADAQFKQRPVQALHSSRQDKRMTRKTRQQVRATVGVQVRYSGVT